MPPTKLQQQSQSPPPNPILTSQVRLMSKKFFAGITKTSSVDAENILALYEDKITFTSRSNPIDNWECPVTAISVAKQVMQNLTIRTSDGDDRTFGFGSATQGAVGALLGGVAGAAVMQKAVRSSGIDGWLPQLAQMGVKTDSFYGNTGKGFTKFTIKIFFGVLAFIVVSMIVIRVIGIITGR